MAGKPSSESEHEGLAEQTAAIVIQKLQTELPKLVDPFKLKFFELQNGGRMYVEQLSGQIQDLAGKVGGLQTDVGAIKRDLEDTAVSAQGVEGGTGKEVSGLETAQEVAVLKDAVKS